MRDLTCEEAGFVAGGGFNFNYVAIASPPASVYLSVSPGTSTTAGYIISYATASQTKTSQNSASITTTLEVTSGGFNWGGANGANG
jgi:hypothetical protein